MKQDARQAIYGIVKRIDDQLRYEHDVLNLIPLCGMFIRVLLQVKTLGIKFLEMR